MNGFNDRSEVERLMYVGKSFNLIQNREKIYSLLQMGKSINPQSVLMGEDLAYDYRKRTE